MAAEPLHEIELNGKKLVFLFMSATVVAVVIFLSGVMVGRGVRVPRADVVEAATDPAADPTALPAATSSSTNDSGPATAQETLTYANRLESATPAEETLKDVSASPLAAPPTPAREPETSAPAAVAPTVAPTPAPAVTKPAAAKPVAAPVVAPPVAAKAAAPVAPAVTKPATPPPAATTAASEPAGNGFVVQVAATRQRGEADAIARRLTGKGYPAFVTTPASGPTMYRVRVGKYTDRREAETVAGRLQREEQFKPWVTR